MTRIVQMHSDQAHNNLLQNRGNRFQQNNVEIMFADRWLKMYTVFVRQFQKQDYKKRNLRLLFYWLILTD